MNDRDLEIVALKLTYVKSTVTFLLAIVAGQLTLLSTVFSDRPDKTWAIAAVILEVFAAIAVQSFADDAIRKVVDKPTSRWLRWTFEMPILSTPNGTGVKTLVGAFGMAFGMAAFLWFTLYS